MDSERKRLRERHAARKTPTGYGNRPGTNRTDEPERSPGDRYTRDSYRRANLGIEFFKYIAQMNNAFIRLSNSDLQSLVAALRSGRITAPYSGLQVSRIIPSAMSTVVRDGLAHLDGLGFSSEQIAVVLELIEHDRENGRVAEPPIDLVTSGPEAPGITNRDTSVVVRELFAHAKNSVLVVGYAVYQGQHVFESLANRMEELPDLDVQFFLNVSRPDRPLSPTTIERTSFCLPNVTRACALSGLWVTSERRR